MATVALAASDATLYPCKVCGERLPASRMGKSRTPAGKLYLEKKCLPCRNTEKRRRERELASAPRGEDGKTIIEALLDSDPSPARLLAELLREDRDRWRLDFATAWREDVAFVLARIARGDERELWREAFESQSSAWQAAWSNAPGPGLRLSPALADGSDTSSPKLVVA